MSAKRSGGLIGLAKRILRGKAQTPLLKNVGDTGGDEESENYEGMNKNYRWFRQDELVRRALITNAYFAVLSAGYDTELEVTDPNDPNPEATLEKYEDVKAKIDEVNRQVNFDHVLFTAQVNRSIFGKAAFEVVPDETTELPAKVIVLESDKIKPIFSKEFGMTHYRYTGPGAPSDKKYPPEKVLYFNNLSLKNNLLGLSDIEPIRDVCKARHELMTEDFGEIVRTIWAPYTILKADTTMMSDEDAAAFITDLAKKARAGKSIAMNESVEAQVVSMSIDFTGLLGMLNKFEEAMQRAFQVPRFLLGKPIENRATAFAELEAYIQGTIAFIQKYLKRITEADWYDPMTITILDKEHSERYEEDNPEKVPPVKVTHQWRTIRTSDIYEMASAVSALWGQMGMGPLGGDKTKVYDMMGWPQDDLSPLERTAAHDHGSWTNQATPAELQMIAEIKSQIQSLQVLLVGLANQAIGGMDFEGVLQQATAAIKLYMDIARRNAVNYLAVNEGIEPQTLSPEAEQEFADLEAQWLADFKKIVGIAVKDTDQTPLRGGILPVGQPFRTLMAAVAPYWETKAGIWARLAALAHDIETRTYNGAIQIYASEAGFKNFEWVAQPGLSRDGPCIFCLGKDGNVYRRGQFMPHNPAHVGCVCIWRITRE